MKTLLLALLLVTSGCATYNAPLTLAPKIPASSLTNRVQVIDARAVPNPSRLDPAIPRDRVIGQWLSAGIVIGGESAAETLSRAISVHAGVKEATLREFAVSGEMGLWANSAHARIVADVRFTGGREVRISAQGDNKFVNAGTRNYEIAVERALEQFVAQLAIADPSVAAR